MVRIAFALFAAGLALSVPVLAQDATPGPDDGRFAFHRVQDGFLRLDISHGTGLDVRAPNRGLGLPRGGG